jgi:phenylpropionate dioxygenase-like ring-hydroxylating dioxygenase large terminal subunit
MDAVLERRIRDEMEAEAARTEPPAAFPKLPDMPIGRYSDERFFELEREYLFRRTWLYACHESELPEPGSFVVFDKTGAPILIVRGVDNEIRAFYNSCRHRGAPVVRDACGTARLLVCQFHSWSYDTTGKLARVPDSRDFVGLCQEDRGLVEVRCESWHGWVFVNEDPDATDLQTFLGPLVTELAELSGRTLRMANVKTYEIPCNWKVTVEAFLEVYHVKTVHPQTVGTMLNHLGAAIALQPNGHSRMVVPYRDPATASVDTSAIPHGDIPTVGQLIRDSSVAYGIFPNVVTPLASPTFPLLVAWPVDANTTKFDVIFFGPDWGDDEKPAYWDFVLAGFDVIMDEDLRNMAPIQRTMKSRGARSIPLNYQERRLFHFNSFVDRAIGVDRIPEELRVPPLLDYLIEA